MPLFVAVLRRSPGGLGVKVARTMASDLFMRDASSKCLSTYLGLWPRHLTQYLCFGTSSLAQRRRLSLVTAPVSPAAESEGEMNPYGFASPGGGRAAQVIAAPEEAELSAAAAKPAAPKKVSLHALRQKYLRREPLSMITAYDYPSARVADGAGADMLLVGDSLGMVVLGQEDTTEVTVSQMVHHCQAAARGTQRAFLVADLPFGSYLTPDQAASNGVRLIKEGRADAVKLEGGVNVVRQVRALVDAGVAVMGHIGFTPQSHSQLGGYRVQGKTADAARRLVDQARALQDAGCFALVLEMVPAPVARLVTREVRVPTIGIGAGVGTSGQVQVFHDILGLYDRVVPRFSRQFALLEEPMRRALATYCAAVKARTFPAAEHSFGMPPAEVQELERQFGHALEIGDTPVNGAASGRASRSADEPGRSGKAPPARAAPASGGQAGPDGLKVVHSVEEWRQLQRSPRLRAVASVGLVPTMGALHAGHLALVERARRENELVVASIFVNPKQFGEGEDLAKYPRTWEEDVNRLRAAGADVLFAPTESEMYPQAVGEPCVYVDVAGLDGAAEAARRPGHFKGVATVVTKLLNIIQPSTAYFGQKDGLQCVLVQRLVRDLNFATKVVVHDTVREPDGLALSSRNRFLTAEERDAAPLVFSALLELSQAHRAGERNPYALRRKAEAVIAAEPLMKLEYVSVADAATGRELDAPLAEAARPLMASIAVKIGSTRLIDNVVLGA